VVSALCAPAILSSPSAVDTLERNSPSGLFESMLESVLESVFDEDSFSTWARSVLAFVVSPDLMSDIRLDKAVSKEFLLLEVLEVDEVEAAASSERRLVLLFDRLEICMDHNPLH